MAHALLLWTTAARRHYRRLVGWQCPRPTLSTRRLERGAARELYRRHQQQRGEGETKEEYWRQLEEAYEENAQTIVDAVQSGHASPAKLGPAPNMPQEVSDYLAEIVEVFNDLKLPVFRETIINNAKLLITATKSAWRFS